MTITVLGSTGYTGMMLLRILADHPDVQTIIPVSRSAAGRPVRSIDPGLGSSIDEKLGPTGGTYLALEEGRVDKTDAVLRSDAILSALPHKTAAAILGPVVGSVPIVDLSADFRLRDASVYETAYQTPQPFPELLADAAYGLPEWNREAIAVAAVVASPGCYPTAALLPLLPFRDIIEAPAIVNAMSGISGAGRKEQTNLLFNERSENANAYNPGRVHRHVPEIEQELGARILFTPHLVPLKQGMLATITVALSAPLTQAQAEQRIQDAYHGSPFVGLSPRGIPETRDVRNTNRCDLGVRVHGEHLQLFSAIDNLYKGASGQVIQNMNIRLSLPEDQGLRRHGEF
jgi:N-acetyl-gamma-glutamyl-phosphate reductase